MSDSSQKMSIILPKSPRKRRKSSKSKRRISWALQEDMPNSPEEKNLQQHQRPLNQVVSAEKDFDELSESSEPSTPLSYYSEEELQGPAEITLEISRDLLKQKPIIRLVEKQSSGAKEAKHKSTSDSIQPPSTPVPTSGEKPMLAFPSPPPAARMHE